MIKTNIKIFSENYVNSTMLALLIITFPFNFKVLFFFRVVDFIQLAFIFYNIKNISIKHLKIITLVIIAILISSLIGIQYSPLSNAGYTKLVYVYKFLSPLILFFILADINFDKKFLHLFYNFFILSYFFLIFYNLFIDFFNIVPEKINTHHFPLTFIDTNKGDKHLLGATLSFLTFFTLLFKNLNVEYKFLKKINYSILIVLITPIFGFYISSNTLILSGLICLIFTIFNHLQNYFYQINKLKNFNFVILFLVLIMFGLIVIFFGSKILYNTHIAINYPVIDLVRFNNLFYNFPTNNILLLFGSGILTTPLFIDQGLLTFIHSFGLIPTLVFFYMFIKSKFYLRLKNTAKFFILMIIMQNLFITEFFLISRYSIPLVLIYITYIKLDLDFEKSKKQQ